MWASADLPVLLVRRGVVGDLEEVQVNHLLHLVVVAAALAHDDRRVKQEDVPAVQWGHRVIIMIILLLFVLVSRIGNRTLLPSSIMELAVLSAFSVSWKSREACCSSFSASVVSGKLQLLLAVDLRTAQKRSHYWRWQATDRRRPNMNPAREEGDSHFQVVSFQPSVSSSSLRINLQTRRKFSPLFSTSSESSSSSCFLLEAMLCWSLNKFGGGWRRPRLVSEDRIGAQENHTWFLRCHKGLIHRFCMWGFWPKTHHWYYLLQVSSTDFTRLDFAPSRRTHTGAISNSPVLSAQSKPWPVSSQSFHQSDRRSEWRLTCPVWLVCPPRPLAPRRHL